MFLQCIYVEQKKSKYSYCSKDMLNDNLRKHCKEVYWNVKLVKGLKRLTFNKTQEKIPKKKDKSDNGENLDSRWSVFQVE